MGDLEVVWENGRKVLNSAHGNQSFGSLHHVWRATFEAIELSQRPLRSVLMLGLGGGSILEILRKELLDAVAVTVVEIDPMMIGLAGDEFLSIDDRTRVIEGDALIQIHALKEQFDLITVDLFSDLDLATGVDTAGFAKALRDRCAPDGLVCFNTVGYDQLSASRCNKVLMHLKEHFGSVKEFHFEGVNRMFVANP
jgi:spermidine synthase